MSLWNSGKSLPKSDSAAPYALSISYSGAMALVVISASAATVATDSTRTLSYTDAKNLSRTVQVVTTSHTASYTVGAAIVITGTDGYDNAYSETVTLTSADGGETLSTTGTFKTVTSVFIPAQADTLGHIAVNGTDVRLPIPTRAVRVGTAGSGALHVGYLVPGGVQQDTYTGVTAAERFPVNISWLYIDSSVQNITLLW